MRLLVLGREGQIARALAEKMTSETSILCLGRPALDITDRQSIERAIAANRPNIVVHAAAYTAVDKAEREPDTAFAINGRGAGHAAAAAAATGLPVIHPSTDYVLPGDKPTPYAEADLPEPLSIYGRSKLAGEMAVMAANPDHEIRRTAWVYAVFGHNFARTMLRLAETRDVVNIVAD